MDETEGESYKADADKLMSGDLSNLLAKPNEPWPEQAEAEQFLVKHADTLRKVHEAAAMGGKARFPTHFLCDPTLTEMTHFQSRLTTHISALLLLEAKVDAYRGDAHAATDAIHALFALAHSCERYPLPDGTDHGGIEERYDTAGDIVFHLPVGRAKRDDAE